MKAVILAGGGGTRLWPLSTKDRPKQFQKLVSDKTMLEETIERLDFLNTEDIYLAINESHLDLTKELCPNIPEKNIIIEPALRDTASCIGLAAAIVEKNHPGEVMAIIYADHLIQNKNEFQNKLKLAAEIAEKENTLNIVEVVATEPNTNYGYVKLGKETKNKDVFNLDSFTEKPDLETAKKFLESGNYLWNTGIYVWKASILLEQYKNLQTETHEKLMQMMQTPEKIKELYPTLEKISIDYAIMEKVDTNKLRIIKADLNWSDIGNWQAIFNELAKSPTENLTRGPVELIDCEGCIVYADNNKKIALIEQKDMVIIDSHIGQLICKKGESKRIKEIVQ